MRKKSLAIGLFALFMAFTPSIQAQSSMSDQQVVEYIKQGTAAGKSQQQLATELGARGVNRTQAERVKKLIEGAQGNKTSERNALEAGGQERMRRTGDSMQGVDASTTLLSAAEQADSLQQLNPTQGGPQVFGRNIFSNRNLTFAPNQNLATPQEYKLGPGDEVIVDIWGSSQNSIRQTISPDGFINIENIGLVYLNGLRIQEAEKHLRQELDKIYAGIGGEGSSDMKLTLGQIRTIQIHIMGEVVTPGSYSLSSLSTAFHALYQAGGISPLGSLRNIHLSRGGKTVATIDVYDFILNGKSIEDLRLQEGDVILVPTYDQLVEVTGKVKRPMYYELKKGETVQQLLTFAGNFTGDAYRKNLSLVRQNGREYQMYTVEEPAYATFPAMDGDVVTVGEMLNRFENRVEIKGAVYRPGFYQYGGKLNTVRQLIEQADGLLGDAFTNRAVLHRQRDNLTLQVVSIDVAALLEGSIPDVPLQRNDVLYIPSILDLEDLGTLTVLGEVARPGDYVFAQNTTLEDLIIQAGGLLETASVVRVDVSRRIRNLADNQASDVVGESFSFSLREGFVVDGTPGFVLQPYDQVVVRKSPAYRVQRSVRVEGEVEYEGAFALTKKNERLSDVIAKTGGLTPYAYVKGARLSRRINDEERARMESALKAANVGKDSVDISQLELGEVYYVGIDLEKAMAHPGGDADLVVREGDLIEIPEYNNTVKISGTVMYPNTVGYDSKKSLKHYIEQAGGYAYRAKKKGAYIIYMNGQVKRVNNYKRGVIEPGCEIIVPKKPESTWNLQSTLSIATTTASLATMAATIANILK
ncbi:MAG: SLBB domain-containing protein [Phocaeicola sp.]